MALQQPGSIRALNAMDTKTLEWNGPDLLDLAEVRRGDGDVLALDASGGISCIDLRAMSVVALGKIDLPTPEVGNSGAYGLVSRWRLHASADGAFAAVVFDGGTTGFVVDLENFAVTMALNGGDYHEDTVPFSACFLSLDGKAVLVHRTDWNRLDASDPRTGELLTPRGPTRYENDQCPAHYLDYFHGRLCASPSGARLFDDGWVWSPVAIPMIFDAATWLTSNVWESEDGPSLRRLAQRDDWNVPACWIDDERIVLGGMEDWDDEEGQPIPAPPGVRIIDLRDPADTPGRTLAMSAAPQALFSDGHSLFAFDGRDTSTWSMRTDACLKVFEGFAASHHHARRKELLELTARRIRILALE
ncbi:hypothetical protein J5226_17430 [Lysobacter sp. K5869]|uniref:hypothetical protein n=1 Tax=Lysobacter sp. K5869 TaxID=2820808 RepID=UPI001C05FB45|nr:hypothetical protein [Lysobacter sp. K5869]QWP75392.1 hypothetical protein J5226_17430 [Lysobacter sp. K5869]